MPLKTLEKTISKNKYDRFHSFIRVKDGVATAHDCDTWYSTPCNDNIGSGIYHYQGFKDGIHLLNNDMSIDDFLDVSESRAGAKTKILSKIVVTRDDMDSLKWVSKAMSTEETRYYLNGVYVDQDCFVATDGHRLHMLKIKSEWIGSHTGGFIIPRKAFNLFISAMKESKANKAIIKIREGNTQFIIGKTTITTKNVDGTYPDYNRVIPSTRGCNYQEYCPKEMAKHKNKINAFSKAMEISVKMITFPENKNTFILRNGLSEELEFDAGISMPYQVSFNYKYLLDMNAGRLYMGKKGKKLNPQTRPHVIKGKDQKTGTEMLGVIMPMRS